MKIRLLDYKDNVTTLGPGIRFVIWTQGCYKNCPGCMSQNSHALNGGYVVDIDKLITMILSSGRTELTISGGEPFLQAKPLVCIINEIRKKIDLGVIIYTGYKIEEIVEKNNQDCNELLKLCDLLIDGEYIDSLNDGKSFRGSSNQRAIALTDRYKDFAKKVGKEDTKVEFFFEEEKIFMIGIPSKQLFDKFKKLKF